MTMIKIFTLVAYDLFMLLLFFKPSSEIPQVSIPMIDKIVHFSLHFILSYLFLKVFHGKTRSLLIFVSIQSLFIETMQETYFERSFEYFDIAANVLGCAFCIVLKRQVEKRPRQRLV